MTRPTGGPLHPPPNNTTGHRPLILRPRLEADREALHVLRARGITQLDTLDDQLKELIRSLRPDRTFSAAELDQEVQRHLAGVPMEDYGTWVHYPWRNVLVHLLDEEEFARVRTDRNRNKITRAEQERLGQLRIGIIGLSVGRSAAITLALERGFAELRLADFDGLDLSNLNRLAGGVHELGLNKAISCARQIAELDPYLQVTCFTEGITQHNLDQFFEEGGPLDLLVEECDSVDIKILARQKAKAMRIPVVMDMSDRGCVDVERFDLEPGRPILHGWIDHLDLAAAGRKMTSEEKVPYMVPIVGTDTLSPRLKASVLELGRSVSTWPQLGSAVMLGGALVAEVCRRIALDQFRTSGRWYVDLNDHFGEEQVAVKSVEHRSVPPLTTEFMERCAQEATAHHKAYPHLDTAQAMRIFEAGALAPSAGNMQPWRFMLHEGLLLLFHDAARSASRWDPDHLIAQIALGTALENMRLRAGAMGVALDIVHHPLPDRPALTALLVPSATGQPPAVDPLADWITQRCTNRKVATRTPLPADMVEALHRAVQAVPDCHLHMFTSQADLNELAGICGGAERVRVLDPVGHHEFFAAEVRWTPEEAARTADGLDLATMEVSPTAAAALRMGSDARAMALLRDWDAGRGLERFAHSGIVNSAAVMLVCGAGDSLAQRLQGGRAAQRAWMEANRLGWAVHPISAPIFLFHAIPWVADLEPQLMLEMERLKVRFDHLLSTRPGRPLFMMRLSQAGPPSARALRRPLQDMVYKPQPLHA
ncbi:MAG: Rv1355c family protein [Flavobacteriales bacterium]|nr:Rv1355c family protein [Flavobacteriales bacterium]